jgi:hypothetical protein
MPTPQINPRFQLFLAVNNLTEESLNIGDEDGTAIIVLNGDRLPWTYHYHFWIERKWREWSATFDVDPTKLHGVQDAQMACWEIHRQSAHEHFDNWLRNAVEGGTK